MKTLADYIMAVQIEEGTDLHAQAEAHLSKANDADAKGDKYGYHMHMTNHHEALSQWHDSKGRGGMAAKHEDLAAHHEDKAEDALNAEASAMRSMRDRTRQAVSKRRIKENADSIEEGLKQKQTQDVKEAYGGLRGNVGDRSKREFKQRELEHELGHEVNPRATFSRPSSSDVPHAVHIDGKKWKTFGSQSHAANVARKIPGATVHKEEYVTEDSMPYPHGKPEVGDKITWYHSNHHPKIEGTVVGSKDGHHIVQSVDPSPRNTEKTVAKYRVYKNNILSVEKQGVAEANKHSFVGKIQRGHELKGKVDQTFKDIGAAQKQGDHPEASKAFRKHERYANLERPGTWTKSKEQGVTEDSMPYPHGKPEVGDKKC